MLPQPPKYTSAEAFLEAILAAVRKRLDAKSHGHVIAECDADELEICAAARASAAAGVSIPLTWVEERLRLTATEQLAIWVLLAHELDPDVRQRIRAMNTESLADPTLDTLSRIVSPGSRRSYTELSAHGALQHWRLVDRTDGDPLAPSHRQTLTVSERVLTLALGNPSLDPSVAEFATAPDAAAAVEDLVVDSQAAARLHDAMQDPTGMTLVIGGVGSGRRSLVTAMGRARNLRFLHIDARKLHADSATCQRQLRDCAREAKLLGRLPLICHLEALQEQVASQEGQRETKSDRLELVEKEFPAVVFATASRPIARRWRTPPTVVELPRLRGDQLATMWSRAIPEASAEDADLLAAMYPFAPALIAASGAAARRQTRGDELTAEHIAQGVTAVLDDRLCEFATRRKISQQTSDLVLPNDQSTAIAELVARIRRRHTVLERWGFADKIGKGVGIAALFSGPPGTGKPWRRSSSQKSSAWRCIKSI